ncbi:MAG: nickel-dependent hydrogenase large subunit [Nocardioides sp.]
MFRGFEIILKGKAPQAGLVVAPRICGICGGSHSTGLLRPRHRLEHARPAERHADPQHRPGLRDAGSRSPLLLRALRD